MEREKARERESSAKAKARESSSKSKGLDRRSRMGLWIVDRSRRALDRRRSAWHGIAMEVYDKMMYDIPTDQGQSRVKSTMVEEEIVVGFEDEVIMIKEQLTEGKKKLGIISIVGMPGLASIDTSVDTSVDTESMESGSEK